MIALPELEQVRQLLCDGLDKLRRNGWCKNSFTNQAGKCCALGAIGVDTYSVAEHSHSAARCLAGAVREQKNLRPHYPKDWTPNRVIIRFNDARTRKFEDVEAIYLRAIEMVEAEIAEAQRG